MNGGAAVPTVICVLGPSRSGTSLTARLLSVAGVYLGKDDELLQKDLHQLEGEGAEVLGRATAANPEGFWEHYRMMRLNERLLRAAGGNWRDPPHLPEDRWEGEEYESLVEEARTLIVESFGNRPLWGWKDPRNSLTLSFWQQVIPAIRPVEMRYVICVRNPLDAAASLQRRDGIPLDQGISLWAYYLAEALHRTVGHPRLVVGYERYFEDAEREAARLARFAGHPRAFDDGEARHLLGKAIDDGLWRNRTSMEAAMSDPRVIDATAAVYMLAMSLATTGG